MNSSEIGEDPKQIEEYYMTQFPAIFDKTIIESPVKHPSYKHRRPR